MRRIAILLALVAALGAGAAWLVTAPDPLPASALQGLTGDAARGATVFAAAGCASCHTAPDGTEAGDAPPVLAGGRRFVSDFGTFVAPNVSPDPVHGIGAWTDAQIVNAVMRGVSPDGAHYYPAFPYGAYARAEPQDMLDLVAHLRTLPGSDRPSAPQEVGFPYSIRRAVGGWKRLYLGGDWVLAEAATPQILRGRYLVEALGHCGECHTPRGALGGLRRDAWLAGAPDPSGEGRIPNITPAALTWSEAEIAAYLQSGFTPSFDTAGGEMAAVVRNTARLQPEDRAAIAAYLKAIPPVE